MPSVHAGVGAVFEVTSDAVAVLERGRVVAWNPAAEQMFGVAAPAVLAGAATPLHPHLPDLLTLDEAAPAVRVELPGRTVEVLRHVVEGRDVLLLRDVTDVRRHADGLRRLAALSAELLAAPQGVQATLQTLGTEAEELIGAAYSVVLLLPAGSSADPAHLAYDAPRHLFPDSPPLGPLLAVPLLAGEVVLGVLAVARPPEAGRFTELDGSLLADLAAHVSVAVRWAQHAEDAREQAALRQDVVDTARHDIRTPLGAGKGYAALLATRLDRMSPAQVATAMDGLRSAFDRIEAFTARLLVDDRLVRVSAEPRWGEVDVVDLLEQVRRDATATTGREDAVLVHREPDAPRVLAGDAEQVREVLDNLVGNALEYAGEAGPVEVTVRSEGEGADEQVRFDVRDRGPGIPEHEHAGLFERWSRTDASRAGMLPGRGLGLSIVQRLVLAHGGLVGVSSRPGEGATFWVTFPASRREGCPPQTGSA